MVGVFPVRQIHVIDANILEKDPSTELMKFEQYIGLQPECTESQNGRKPGVICMKKEKGHVHPKVDENVLEILKEFFRPHVRRLQTLINRTLSWMPSYLETKKSKLYL